MKKLKCSIWVLLLMSALSATAAKKPKPDEEVVYKKTEQGELDLHIFYPDGHQKTDKRPVAVFFHGGGWKGGTPSMFYRQCVYLSSRGIVAISAEYRLAKNHKTTPVECVKDGKSAIRWIRKNAAQLGIDPDKLIAGGGSAGGHVAASTGTATSFEEETDDKSVSRYPNALVLFNPVYDNSENNYGHDRVKAYWKEISPMHNITEKTPPTAVFFGTEDGAARSAPEYRQKMEALGIRSDLYMYEGEKHAFYNQVPRMHLETLAEMDRFLTSLGYLKPIKLRTNE